MNRRRRREIAKHAPHKQRKIVERELRRRDVEKWCDHCTFDQHGHCLDALCGCPGHETKVADGEGKVIEGVTQRESGLLIARPELAVPRRGSRVGS